VAQSHILIAVSSPWASDKLVLPLADLARRLDATASIAHVAQTLEEDETEDEARRRGEQTLEVMAEGLRSSGIACDTLMLFSTDVAKAILSTAQSRRCSLLVLGLTGKGRLRRLIGGDVPSDIIRQAQIPVLLCPAPWQGRI
jgi:nucleotide-binding universal stress UspA family protein